MGSRGRMHHVPEQVLIGVRTDRRRRRTGCRCEVQTLQAGGFDVAEAIRCRTPHHLVEQAEGVEAQHLELGDPAKDRKAWSIAWLNAMLYWRAASCACSPKADTTGIAPMSGTVGTMSWRAPSPTSPPITPATSPTASTRRAPAASVPLT